MLRPENRKGKISEKDLNIYCDCMKNIIRRLEFIEGVRGSLDIDSFADLQIEGMSLHYRMIFETIVFSSFVAQTSKLDQVQQALRMRVSTKKIIEKCRSLNKDYYPIPSLVKKDSNAPTEIIENGTSSIKHLSERELFEGLSETSKILHAKKPRAPAHKGMKILEQQRDWHTKICGLIQCHYIKILGDDDFYLFKAGGNRTLNPTVFRAVPVNPK